MALNPIDLLSATRATVHCVTEPTGFVILTHAIQYLTSPGTYTRQGFNDWQIVSLPAEVQ